MSNRVSKKFLKRRPHIIQKKFEKAQKNKDYKLVMPDKSNPDYFLMIFTPKTGYYKNQTAVLSLQTAYGNNTKYYFPMDPPLIKFISSIFHPNVSNNGSICVDFLKGQLGMWSPIHGFDTIFYSILTLLTDPNPDSPLNGVSARLFKKCQKALHQETKNKKNVSVQMEEASKTKAFQPFVDASWQVYRTTVLKDYEAYL